jgi:L-asparagine transporter-like permease
MATQPAHVKVYSSAIPLSIWGGLALVAIALVIMWAMPATRMIVGIGLTAGILLAAVLVILRRRWGAGDSSAAPLHLRD